MPLRASPFSHQKAERRVVPMRAMAAGLALLALAGCNRVRHKLEDSVNNNAQMRQAAISSARESCIQQASAKAPPVPGIQTRISSYCDCFATKGLGQFTNAELASIGFHSGRLTADQQQRVLEGAVLCKGALMTPGHSTPRLQKGPSR